MIDFPRKRMKRRAMKVNELLLLSKNDIPFVAAQVNIHQPTISEISFISEESFHIGCQLLTFSKNLLSQEDKSNLADTSDFDIFMSIMNGKEAIHQRECAMKVLTLLFPSYQISFAKDKILLVNEELSTTTEINSQNFLQFQEIVKTMFDMEGLMEEEAQQNYNPADAFAAKIAEKLKRRNNKLAEQKQAEPQKIAIFTRYVSILAVGERKDINSLMQYSVYQLKDEMK